MKALRGAIDVGAVAQTIAYMRGLDLKFGLILNFSAKGQRLATMTSPSASASVGASARLGSGLRPSATGRTEQLRQKPDNEGQADDEVQKQPTPRSGTGTGRVKTFEPKAGVETVLIVQRNPCDHSHAAPRQVKDENELVSGFPGDIVFFD